MTKRREKIRKYLKENYKRRNDVEEDDIKTIEKNISNIVSPTQAVMFPSNQQHVREDGRYCGKCESFLPLEHGQKVLQETLFFEKVFHGHDDGHDFKPQHVGDVRLYSICDQKNCGVHKFANANNCSSYRERKTFLKIYKK